jgi:hypothetical protein
VFIRVVSRTHFTIEHSQKLCIFRETICFDQVEIMSEKPTTAFILPLIGGILVLLGGLVWAALGTLRRGYDQQQPEFGTQLEHRNSHSRSDLTDRRRDSRRRNTHNHRRGICNNVETTYSTGLDKIGIFPFFSIEPALYCISDADSRGKLIGLVG